MTMNMKPTLWTFPREIHVEISRWIPYKDSRQYYAFVCAGKVIIKDIHDGETYANDLLHSFNDNPAIVYADGEEQNEKILL